jgi:hypothetical protein
MSLPESEYKRRRRRSARSKQGGVQGVGGGPTGVASHPGSPAQCSVQAARQRVGCTSQCSLLCRMGEDLPHS